MASTKRAGRRRIRGVTLLYDAVFACLVLFIALAIIAYSIPQARPAGPSLQGYATSVLIWLDYKGALAPPVYSQDSAALSAALSELCPGDYCLQVYSPPPEWRLLWTCTSPGFDPNSASASQPYPLVGYQGNPDPRVVVLLLN